MVRPSPAAAFVLYASDMLFFTGAYVGARRAMARDQRRPIPCTLPLWRLIFDEIALMARRIGRWKVWSILAVVFVCIFAVQLAFSTSTPGPALTELWRWIVALVLTVATLGGWAVVHAVRSERAVSQST